MMQTTVIREMPWPEFKRWLQIFREEADENLRREAEVRVRSKR